VPQRRHSRGATGAVEEPQNSYIGATEELQTEEPQTCYREATGEHKGATEEPKGSAEDPQKQPQKSNKTHRGAA
jgi:hypothetical protein